MMFDAVFSVPHRQRLNEKKIRNADCLFTAHHPTNMIRNNVILAIALHIVSLPFSSADRVQARPSIFHVFVHI